MADTKITALTENTTPLGTDIIPMVDDPGGTPATQKITLVNLGIIDGWIPASETWTYASPSTITVPTGAASKYQVGDRIKWTQTTVKYGVIVAVADTVLTIQVNTDYVVANAAISLNYYSHQANPIGYPGWFTMAAPTFDVAYCDNGSGGQPTTSEHRISITGRTCFVHYRGTGTKAGTNPYIVITASSIPAPVNAASLSCLGSAYAADLYQGGFYRSGNPWIIVTSINIPDNTALSTAITFNATYEI